MVVVVVVEGIGDGGEGGRINALLCVTANGRRKWKRENRPPGVSEIATRRRLYNNAKRRANRGTSIKSVVSER